VCNEYERWNREGAFTDDEFSRLVPVAWAGGLIPNTPAEGSVRISETAPIARRSGDGVELSLAPWAWKGPRGAPVFNFKSEGRSFAHSDRVLIPANGFYEYTAPADPKQKLKDKHRFALAGEPWFWIAGIVKEGAFTMLTTAPGPDIAPYHGRQIVVLPRAGGLDWLDLAKPEEEILRALPAGSLTHQQVR
jgi:putative SOS response-associated peptidase YedK